MPSSQEVADPHKEDSKCHYLDVANDYIHDLYIRTWRKFIQLMALVEYNLFAKKYDPKRKK